MTPTQQALLWARIAVAVEDAADIIAHVPAVSLYVGHTEMAASLNGPGGIFLYTNIVAGCAIISQCYEAGHHRRTETYPRTRQQTQDVVSEITRWALHVAEQHEAQAPTWPTVTVRDAGEYRSLPPGTVLRDADGALRETSSGDDGITFPARVLHLPGGDDVGGEAE